MSTFDGIVEGEIYHITLTPIHLYTCPRMLIILIEFPFIRSMFHLKPRNFAN